MARPRVEDRRVVLGVRVPQSLFAEVERAATGAGLSRAAYVERVLRAGMKVPLPAEPDAADDAPDRDEFIESAARKFVYAHGLTSPHARTLATREYEARWGRLRREGR